MVGMFLTNCILSTLWISIFLSSEPPPVANREEFHGHHLIALTAAECSLIVQADYFRFQRSQTLTKLSLPPEAN